MRVRAVVVAYAMRKTSLRAHTLHAMNFVGDRSAYKLPSAPAFQGGQAEIFRAVRRVDGVTVAFKRLRQAYGTAKQRMRREIDVQSTIDHEHVMPVLDADRDHAWLVMPWADGSLADVGSSLVESELADALDQAAQGLAAAHVSGHVHRDVTPANILYFDEPDARRWVVADWGLVRRPRGQTTNLLTTTGVSLGTQGYIAPEVFTVDAHSVTEAADVYSLGCVAAWTITGVTPAPGAPTLPTGPWRSLLRRATQADPGRRISDMADFRAELFRVTSPAAPTPAEQREALLERARNDDLAAAMQLLDLALASADDSDLHLDIIPHLRGKVLPALVRRRPDDLLQVVEQMLDHQERNWDHRAFRRLDDLLFWMLDIARAASRLRELDTLEDISEPLFDSASWDQFPLYEPIRQWMQSLDEDAQHAVASALRRSPQGRAWLRDRLELNVDNKPVLYHAIHGR